MTAHAEIYNVSAYSNQVITRYTYHTWQNMPPTLRTDAQLTATYRQPHFSRFSHADCLIFIKSLDLELTPGVTLYFGGAMMKISEVSEQCDISTDTLRYYERIGLLPPVNRSDSGIRDYGELDVRRVEFIKCMRNAGLPIVTLIEYYRLVQQGDATIETRKEILKEQREQLVAKMDEIQKINRSSGS